jgi:hypothetical protein
MRHLDAAWSDTVPAPLPGLRRVTDAPGSLALRVDLTAALDDGGLHD